MIKTRKQTSLSVAVWFFWGGASFASLPLFRLMKLTMKQKIAWFLLILNFILLHFSAGAIPIAVNGIINGSVTLPSGYQGSNPTQIQWDIKKNLIVTYFVGDAARILPDRFKGRMHLDEGNGTLRIDRLRMEDSNTYSVRLFHGGAQHTADVTLSIYEKTGTPKLQVLPEMVDSGLCSMSVRCTTLHGLWISATKGSIGCSVSNPASTSSAPLLPVPSTCYIPIDDPDNNPNPDQRFYYSSIVIVIVYQGVVEMELQDHRRRKQRRMADVKTSRVDV
ncbi:hypothetical protein AAFF_G00218580 [Aldrovandia affinis]|uniref:Immunoglobulin V-set domain-containing protein n=1 Tax=Aldrovandia affinis TaxID=143900 RepID=A0AAD7WVH7_9TELE|nr:hypothetical protein AAFF_G00218580 [Aldrovandia affinis]